MDDQSAERMMDRMDDKREMVSALADGQLAGEAFARGVEIAATDAAARDAWHAYHLIGDVLRSGELARCAPADRFLGRLQQRLRDEQIAIETPAVQLSQVRAQSRGAANDSAFRWKLVAAAASVAAVSAIAWTVLAVPDKAAAPQLASAVGAPVLASTQRGVMIRDPRLDEFLAAHRQLGGAALVAPAGYLRNATFDGSGR
jgi:sigma-E factor negative regulatory protein RseA